MHSSVIYIFSLHYALPISMPLRLRTMSVTSSVTPLMVENSCATPSMRTDVTAAPESEASSTRRSERSEEHTSELQSRLHLVYRLLHVKNKYKMSQSV